MTVVASSTAPVARPEPKNTALHGVTLSDNYAWLRDKSSPETLAYLTAENVFTEAFMAPTAALQKRLYDEMLSHIKETDESVPYLMKGFFYYTRTVAGLQYPIHCRRVATGPAFDESEPEEILLDVNKLAEGQPFMSVGGLAVTPSGTILAYTTDNTGFRQYTLHIRDLSTGLNLPDTALRVGSIVWAADSKTLFYTTEDETTKRHDHLFRHTLGTSVEQDTLVMHEEDERFNLGIGKTRDGKYLMIEAGSHTTNECHLLPADTPEDAFKLIAPRIDDQEYYPEHRDGLLYIRTNDIGRNFRLVTAPIATPERQNWQELLPLAPDAPLEDVDLFQTFLVTSRRELGLPVMDVFLLGSGEESSTQRDASSRPERSEVDVFTSPAKDASSRPERSEVEVFNFPAKDASSRPERSEVEVFNFPAKDASSRPERSEVEVFNFPAKDASSRPERSGVEVFNFPAKDASSRPERSEVEVFNFPAKDASSRPERSEVERPPHFALGPATRIAFPEPTYSAGPHINREFSTTRFRYSYQSLVSPASVYEYDTTTDTSALLKMQEVPGGFDPALYASERVVITAADGVEVPVSIVYRRDRFTRDATNPLYVYGYGSYGYALPVSFSGARLSLLDRGLVLAYAHIRGGGEMGDPWHDAGKMMQKLTTFTDFTTAVEQLTAKGYGDPSRVAIEGGSAGGLLMGAVVNQRPELFRVVLSHVPFVDVMNTMLDATLPLTVAEYEEWGNPNEPEAFAYMLAYSPYDNLKPGDYPAMLVKTSLNDSQVMYWEPAKYVAQLRTLKQNETPLLLHINMDAGHGGASGRYDYLKEIAFDYAFLLTQLEVEP